MGEKVYMSVLENHNLRPSINKIWFGSLIMNNLELEYVKEVYEMYWRPTVGENINQVERIAEKLYEDGHFSWCGGGEKSLLLRHDL